MKDLLAVARGSRPADLVIRGARVANVFSLEYEEVDVAVFKDKIAGVGMGYEGKEVVDAAGKVLIPGMIDGHVHIESTMLTPAVFADTVITRGTTAVMADPHEIANVLGMKGIEYMFLSARGLPVDILLGAPSCVPASSFETPYEVLGIDEVREMFERGWCQHLGEVMDFPGLIHGNDAILGKLKAAGSAVLTGHAPGVSGKELCAYIASGIASDHECTMLEEAREKLRRGMWIMMREGASSPNMTALLPIIKENPAVSWRCMAVTDDVTAKYLVDVGHMDVKVRLMIREGIDPLVALRMVTLSPATYFGLKNRGAIGPGLLADMALVDDLAECRVDKLWKNGKLVVDGGKLCVSHKVYPKPAALQKLNVNVVPLTEAQLEVPAPVRSTLRVIGRGELLTTESLAMIPTVKEGLIVPDAEKGIAKIAVQERHRGTGRFAVGFVFGLGLKHGAIGSSVAHDAHNFVVAGMDDKSMVTAMKWLCKHGGGLVAVDGDKVLASFELPIAGLMTDIDAAKAAKKLAELEKTCGVLGMNITHPFMALSFLCLSVIPELKITDRGYVDIVNSTIKPLFCSSDSGI